MKEIGAQKEAQKPDKIENDISHEADKSADRKSPRLQNVEYENSMRIRHIPQIGKGPKKRRNTYLLFHG